MSEEDDRTLWCGNLSEKVTEELLYELFLQAGPVEMVKIPRDNDKRQRSYAFITYTHGASVDYALNIYNGSKLFNRQLLISKKSRNGPNSNSPKVNNNSPQQNRGQQQQHNQGNAGNMANMGQNLMSFAGMSPGAMMGMLRQMNQQAMAEMMLMQQNAVQNQMNRNNDRPQQQQQQQQHQHPHQQKPYSRDRDGRDRGDNHSRDRNEGQLYSRDRGHGRGRNNGGQRRNDFRGRR